MGRSLKSREDGPKVMAELCAEAAKMGIAHGTRAAKSRQGEEPMVPAELRGCRAEKSYLLAWRTAVGWGRMERDGLVLMKKRRKEPPDPGDTPETP
jgi:hypothetical protein